MKHNKNEAMKPLLDLLYTEVNTLVTILNELILHVMGVNEVAF